MFTSVVYFLDHSIHTATARHTTWKLVHLAGIVCPLGRRRHKHVTDTAKVPQLPPQCTAVHYATLIRTAHAETIPHSPSQELKPPVHFTVT